MIRISSDTMEYRIHSLEGQLIIPFHSTMVSDPALVALKHICGYVAGQFGTVYETEETGLALACFKDLLYWVRRSNEVGVRARRWWMDDWPIEDDVPSLTRISKGSVFA